jgi:hypothetical protein
LRDRTIDVTEPLAAVLEVAYEKSPVLEQARADLMEAVALARKDQTSLAGDHRILQALADLAKSEDPLDGNATELTDRCAVHLEEKPESLDVSAVLRRYGFETKSIRKDGGDPKYRYSLRFGDLAELLAHYGSTAQSGDERPERGGAGEVDGVTAEATWRDASRRDRLFLPTTATAKGNAMASSLTLVESVPGDPSGTALGIGLQQDDIDKLLRPGLKAVQNTMPTLAAKAAEILHEVDDPKNPLIATGSALITVGRKVDAQLLENGTLKVTDCDKEKIFALIGALEFEGSERARDLRGVIMEVLVSGGIPVRVRVEGEPKLGASIHIDILEESLEVKLGRPV